MSLATGEVRTLASVNAVYVQCSPMGEQGERAPRPRSRRGDGEQLREVLLDAAIELLGEVQDVQQVSVRAVTSRVGVSPAALYLHFPDKAALTVAIRDRGFATLLEHLLAAEAAAGTDPFARLAAMATAYLRFAREQSAMYAVLFHTHVPRAGVPLPPSDDGLGPGERVFAAVRAAVSRCLAADGAEPGDQRVFEEATVIWMALHGRAAVSSAMPSFPFPDTPRFAALLTGRLRSATRLHDPERTAGPAGLPHEDDQ